MCSRWKRPCPAPTFRHMHIDPPVPDPCFVFGHNLTMPTIDLSPAQKNLTCAIEQGNADAVKALCLNLAPQERRACAGLVAELGQQVKHSLWPAAMLAGKWRVPAGSEHHRAHDLATLACGDPPDMLNLVEYVGVRWEEASHFLEALGRDPVAWRQALQATVEKQLSKQIWGIEQTQRLVASGLIDRPSSLDYTTALIGWPRVIHWQSPGGWASRLQADPGVYDAFLAFFDHQGNAEFNLAAMEKYAKKGEAIWSQTFLDGIGQGHYTRSQLLERTLGTLESDWPQTRAGWFSRFHQLLGPSVDEMAPHAQRYLGLTQSRIPPTVTLALESLRTMFDAQLIDGQELLSALAPAFYATAKAQVLAALKLLQSVCAKDPSLQPQASQIAMPGLLHPTGDVQAALLKALASWGLDDHQRNDLKAYAAGIAQTHRALFSSLTGEQLAPSLPANQHIASPPTKPVDGFDPLDDARRLRPLALDAEGIERVAFALENPDDIDELECVIAALVQASPLAPELRQRCAPLLKRARKIRSGSLSFELVRLLVFVLTGERVPTAGQRIRQIHGGTDTPTPRESFALRIDDLIELAERNLGLIPVSTPSHRSGFLDRAVLQERLSGLDRRGEPACAAEVELARRRTLRHPTDQARFEWTAGIRTMEYDGQTFHFPKFDIVQGGVAVEEHHLEYLALADLRYEASTMPGRLEPFFAAGSQALASNLDWSEARWCNQAYIEPLLQASTPITTEYPMAVLVLALALGGKQPGQTAMAVDALTLAHRQGRLHRDALAATLRTLFASSMVKAKRYAASLGNAVRNEPTTTPTVFACLCDIVRAHATQPIKDVGALLDLLLEAGLQQGLHLPEDVASILRSTAASATLQRKQKALLTQLV